MNHKRPNGTGGLTFNYKTYEDYKDDYDSYKEISGLDALG